MDETLGQSGLVGPTGPALDSAPGVADTITTCDSYEPGHQIHYQHQGLAVRSPSRSILDTTLVGGHLLLTLGDGSVLRWWHHDPVRLDLVLDLLRGKGVVYPTHHALRIGPYWFNCATQDDPWEQCLSGQQDA